MNVGDDSIGEKYVLSYYMKLIVANVTQFILWWCCRESVSIIKHEYVFVSSKTWCYLHFIITIQKILEHIFYQMFFTGTKHNYI